MAEKIPIPSVGSPAQAQDDREKAADKSYLKDLSEMSFDELWLMHQKITKILSDKITAEKQELENRLARLNQTDVTGELEGDSSADTSTTRRKYPKVLPKYFNPQSPSKTWSGRGKQPRWLVEALKSGHKLDDFRIIDPADKEEKEDE